MRSLGIFISTILAVILIGCSSSSPSVPDSNASDESSNHDYVPIVNHTVGSVTSMDGVFGVWKLRVDADNLSAELIPARNASAIGDIFDADLQQFLTVSPCSNCLTVTKLTFDRYYLINMEIRMRHPFSNITSRPDLHGFDVRLIFISNNNYNEDFSQISIQKPDGSLEGASIKGLIYNADGYTSHFDEIATDTRYFVGGTDVAGNLNPFLRFFEDYSTPAFDPRNPVGQNVMKVGASYSARTAVFQIGSEGGGTLEMLLVADVSYGQSAVLANRQSPLYYLPAFHRTEPWRAEYWIENNTLDPANPMSTADVMVQVFDWQHNATVDASYPNPMNLSGIPESSRVSQVEFYIPRMMNDVVTVSTPESGDGSPTNPLLYRIPIIDQHMVNGVIPGLLAIRDELHGSQSPSGRRPIPVSPSGFPYATSDIRDYTLYQIIYVNVPAAPDGNYHNELEINDDLVGTGSSIRLEPKFFMDKSNKMFQYRWDFDYNGVTFDIDGAGLPSPEIPFSGAGNYVVGLRVRTNSVPPREYIYAIPIAAQGIFYDHNLQYISSTNQFASRIGSSSVASIGDYTYIAYTADITGKDDIFLAIGDRSGNYEIVPPINLTQDLVSFSQHPSIAVVTDGTNPGIYVTFEYYNGLNFDIKSTYGNLDGTGFETSNIKDVVASVLASYYRPTIIHHWNTLAVYCQVYSTITSDSNIIVIRSLDYGQTWASPNMVNDVSTGWQGNATAEYSSAISRVLCAWTDEREYSTMSSDIYMAESQYPDISLFNPSIRVSVTNDKTAEFMPDLSIHFGAIGLAYNTQEDGSSDINIAIKYFSHYYDNYMLFELNPYPTGSRQGPPSIHLYDSDSAIIAFQSWNSSESNQYIEISNLEFLDTISPSAFTGLVYELNGDVNYSQKPAISSTFAIPQGYGERDAYDVRVFWTTYEYGNIHRTVPSDLYYGVVKSMGFMIGE